VTAYRGCGGKRATYDKKKKRWRGRKDHSSIVLGVLIAAWVGGGREPKKIIAEKKTNVGSGRE